MKRLAPASLDDAPRSLGPAAADVRRRPSIRRPTTCPPAAIRSTSRARRPAAARRRGPTARLRRRCPDGRAAGAAGWRRSPPTSSPTAAMPRRSWPAAQLAGPGRRRRRSAARRPAHHRRAADRLQPARHDHRPADPTSSTCRSSRRCRAAPQSLPGILVGRELVKQTHLYTGEEVRVVSPLSDPSNPDATGTPIPFNRDYRVAGIFYTGMYEYDLKYVYVTLDSLQDFLDRGDAVDGIEVRIEDADDTDRYVPPSQRRPDPRGARPRYRIVRTGASSTAACSRRSSSRRSRCSSCSGS